MIFLDTETLGLHGSIVIIQYAIDDGPVTIHPIWTEPIHKTLSLIEYFMTQPIIGFNLAFDHFHLCQTYTTLSLFPDKDVIPIEHIDEYVDYEPLARDGLCLKPVSCLDLMLHARKTEYQSTMGRKDIKIKRVPTVLAWQLVDELNKRVIVKDIYFANKSNPRQRWRVDDLSNEDGENIPQFKDIVLGFNPSAALKILAIDALKVPPEQVLFHDMVSIGQPEDEYGFAPFAKALPKGSKGWPLYVKQHVSHWANNDLAKKYAEDDVIYTRGLYEYFGKPPFNDNDSILATMVGAVRWKGYKVDIERIQAVRQKAQDVIDTIPFNFNAPAVCAKYLKQVLSPNEQIILTHKGKMSTKGLILEEIAKWWTDMECPQCHGSGCADCLFEGKMPHPAASRAREILDARHAKKRIDLLDKFLIAGRFHAANDVIGALSYRMSGSGGDLNSQGINRSKDIRSCFPLAFPPMQLAGGDFEGFEVVLMDAIFNDPELHKDLVTKRTCTDCKGVGCKECSGVGKVSTKFHGILGEFLFPGKTYDDILLTKGLPGEQDIYSRSKNGSFCLFYGGDDHSLHNRVGIEESVAQEAFSHFIQKYKVWGHKRQEIFDMFCSMRQPKGIGSKVEWHEPADYIESIFGFRRYFTLENMIVKALFNLANDPPKEWLKLEGKIVRRDREQSISGACRSALFACAFNQQAANMRAAGNHIIQSAGASITKMLQVKLWELQPPGIHPWVIQPLNVHDEIMAPTTKPEAARDIVDNFINDMKERVPLIAIDWKDNLTSWADK